jgi:hypothetical protein
LANLQASCKISLAHCSFKRTKISRATLSIFGESGRRQSLQKKEKEKIKLFIG